MSTPCTVSLGQHSCVLDADSDIAARICESLKPYLKISSISTKCPESWTVSLQRSRSLIGSKDELGVRVTLLPSILTVALRSDDDAALCLSASRHVRAILRLLHYSTGSPHIHAALLEYCGNGLLLAGPKRSGKTSLMLALLAESEFGFVSNDDTTLLAHENSGMAHGWPRSIRIRGDCAHLLDRISRRTRTTLTLAHPLSKGVNIPAARTMHPDEVVHVFPHELAYLANAKLFAAAPISHVIFPAVDAHERMTSGISILPTAEGIRRLLSNTLPMSPFPQHATLNALSSYFAVPAVDTIRERLVAVARQARYCQLTHSRLSLQHAAGELLTWVKATSIH